MAFYNAKGQEFFKLDYSNKMKFELVNTDAVDKIRITIGGSLRTGDLVQASVNIYSDLTDSIIGVVAYNFCFDAGGGDYLFIDPMHPANSMEFFYPIKKNFKGSYYLKPLNKDGTPPTDMTDEVYLLVEYFSRI